MSSLALAAIALTCTPSSPASHAAGEDSHERIAICPVRLTDQGRSSTFRFSYSYRVETDAKGYVASVREVRVGGDCRLVDVDGVVACSRGWRLQPGRGYLVTLCVGTTGGASFMSLYDFDDDPPGGCQTAPRVVERMRRQIECVS